MELENNDKALNFLDIKITNPGTGRYDFQIHRKNAITNVQIRKNSCHDPKIMNGVFKGFVHRAIKLCSEQHLQNELDFLVEVFTDNGYDEKPLKDIIKEIKQK